ncbi:MAG: ATP-binding protein [Eubacteriaceae bacterium]|nr:ATP-binding protein [Eubacteriaceae bacterium]
MDSNSPTGSGIEDFKKLREKEYAYVDKTALIKRFLENPCAVALFTRPRRFGKTLAMSMVRHFFEIGTDPALFRGLEIMDDESIVEAHMGKYPVAAISLKDTQGSSMKMARGNLAFAIRAEASRLDYLLDSSLLNRYDKDEFERLISIQGNDDRLHESLAILTQLLNKHFGKPAILLIDEYDVPLDKAWQHEYYDEMLIFIRSMFSLALKGNSSLEFAMLTGCLRVSKESIFTEVNNFSPYSIGHPLYSDSFGFTEAETSEVLASRGLSNRMDDVREWYDGYCFAGTQIYCPWDVVKFCDDAKINQNAPPQPYWMNTGGNAIIKQLANMAGQSAKEEIGTLVDGGSIVKRINDQLSYSDLEQTIDNIWSFMYAAGYLTAINGLKDGRHELAIPNESVRRIFVEQIGEWFKSRVAANTTALSSLRHAFSEGDSNAAQTAMCELLIDFISARDYSAKENKKESFYHGLLLGALADMEGWSVSSNEESGYGFWDISAKNNKNTRQAFIIEAKYSDSLASLKSASDSAIEQIEARKYWKKLAKDGARDIWLYGAAFFKKDCCISSKHMSLEDS